MSAKGLGKVQQFLTIAAVLLFGAGIHRGAEAATYFVPDTYGTVQACINAAVDGDTCLVRPGTYHENIVVDNKSITIQSTDGPAATILDGNCAGSVVNLSGFYPAAAVLDGFTVTNGCAADAGGGISIVSITTTLRNCVITNNSAPSGGGIASDTAQVMIENCTISANASTDPLKGGGGIYSYFDLMSTTHSIVSGNTASGSGGGILINMSMWADNEATIVDNSADQFGGGVFCDNCVYVADTNVIARNAANLGGGVYSAGGFQAHVEVVNSTITGNQANEGGGFYSRPSSDTVIILNSIIHGNSSLPVFQYVNPCSSIAYSDIEGGFAGQGNINANPLFANAATGDYRLQPQSPCIDTGTFSPVSSCAQVYTLSAVDIAGTPRPQGPAFDMGAYEYIPRDLDGDGFYDYADCNDHNAAIYPGAPEIKRDGIDQDCNGYDLTINITKATWSKGKKTLTVEATSLLKERALLQVVGYGSMTYSARKNIWSKTVANVAVNPGTVTVSGVEGRETATVTALK